MKWAFDSRSSLYLSSLLTATTNSCACLERRIMADCLLQVHGFGQLCPNTSAKMENQKHLSKASENLVTERSVAKQTVCAPLRRQVS